MNSTEKNPQSQDGYHISDIRNWINQQLKASVGESRENRTNEQIGDIE